ncbi:MAG TPA: response regulator transcription factor [Marmoricola sp.]|nr:response regulator transcription factor [Marmoricola sp.]
MIGVVTADDQALIRDALRTIIEREPDLEVVGEAADGDEAIAAVRRHRPDVVLMDIRMPGRDGIEATRALLAEPDPPKVLMLTTFDLDEYVHACLRAGASGFLLKDTQPAGIVAAVRAAYAGDATLSPAVTQRLITSYVQAPSPSANLPATLTSREVDVLRAIARGLSNAEVARELYVGETTVKTHVTAILAKLGVRDRLQAVIAAYESGLVRPGS